MEDCFQTDRDCPRNGSWKELGMYSVWAVQRCEQFSIASVIAKPPRFILTILHGSIQNTNTIAWVFGIRLS